MSEETAVHETPSERWWDVESDLGSFLFASSGAFTQQRGARRHCDPGVQETSIVIAGEQWRVGRVDHERCVFEGGGLHACDGCVSLPVCGFSGALFPML